jgi:hypothetical protein
MTVAFVIPGRRAALDPEFMSEDRWLDSGFAGCAGVPGMTLRRR